MTAKKNVILSLLFASFFLTSVIAFAAAPMSEDTQSCIECHSSVTPGIVSDWRTSRHAGVTPAEGLKKSELKRRISIKETPEGMADHSVGCAECHTMNAGEHKDSFEHNDFKVHVVVTPKDCASCHPVEVGQYGKNLMSHAYGNLKHNTLYTSLVNSVNGIQVFERGRLIQNPADESTNADSCFYCHGTVVTVTGSETRETEQGEMSFPILGGWPNQGVGRINPDGSMGSCTACHARHAFSIEVARKPYTCSECHKGPDVPGYKVYEVSKHGNIFSSQNKSWDFHAVPWTVGKDFNAPTCAACHVSLITSSEGGLIAKRTHQMSDRISWRLLGLIYAHPHPKSPDTSLIRNKAGLPLPTELTGEPVADCLISRKEQAVRQENMEKVCLACHASDWVKGQFARFEHTIQTTNQMTLAATRILMTAWDKGAAMGPAQKDGMFNEPIEKMWTEQWFFYANTVRYASAMMGADYGTFASGRWYLSKNLREMMDWLDFKLGLSMRKK
jgi:hypothetical protein